MADKGSLFVGADGCRSGWFTVLFTENADWEVDNLLSEHESARSCVREIHPEICFWALAGRPMEHNKRTREGFSERKQVLQSVYPHTNDVISCALSTYRRKEVARDDILDALSAAVTATVGMEGLVSIPETPQCDERGLRMEMVYASGQCVRETLEGV